VAKQKRPWGQFHEQEVPPGGLTPNFVKNLPLAVLLDGRFLLDLGKIYFLLELMKDL